MEAQAAAVGGRKEAGTWSQTQGDFTEKSTSTSIKKQLHSHFPRLSAFLFCHQMLYPMQNEVIFPAICIDSKRPQAPRGTLKSLPGRLGPVPLVPCSIPVQPDLALGLLFCPWCREQTQSPAEIKDTTTLPLSPVALGL